MKTISFVIPVYNEEKRLSKTFKALEKLQPPRGRLALSGVEGLKLEEVIFVDDGSNDRTLLEIRHWKLEIEKKLKTQINLLSYTQNQGKGFALRMGMLASSSDYTLFFDADVATPLSQLSKFVPYMKKSIDVIIGTRKNDQSSILKHQPFPREMLGQGFTRLARFILQTRVSDFTCGFKAFSKKAKEGLFSKMIINGWGFDAEALFLAKRLNLEVLEVPVLWADDQQTKVRLWKAVPQTLLELFLILWYHQLLQDIRFLANWVRLRYHYRLILSRLTSLL